MKDPVFTTFLINLCEIQDFQKKLRPEGLIFFKKTRFFNKKWCFFFIKIAEISVISILNVVSKKVSNFQFAMENPLFERPYGGFQNRDNPLYFGFLTVFLKPPPSFDQFSWNHLRFQQIFFLGKLLKIFKKIVVSWPIFGRNLAKMRVSKKHLFLKIH